MYVESLKKKKTKRNEGCEKIQKGKKNMIVRK